MLYTPIWAAFLFFVGQQISLMSYGILLAIPFWIAVRNAVTAEEKLLLKYFSKEYAAYAKHMYPDFFNALSCGAYKNLEPITTLLFNRSTLQYR